MKTKQLTKLLTGLIASLLAATSFAFTNEVTLDFQDAHIKGENVIFLKKALKDQYPNLDLHNQYLKNIVVIGKSKHGYGQVQMRVKNWVSSPKVVDGNKYDFHKHSDRSFDYVTLRNDRYYSDGRWQLLTKGNFKIRKVILVMEDDRLASRNWWKPLNDRVTEHKPHRKYRTSSTRGKQTNRHDYYAYN